MYKCNECECVFEEPTILETTYEKYYGLENDHYTYLCLELCPYCGSDSLEEYEEVEEYE